MKLFRLSRFRRHRQRLQHSGRTIFRREEVEDAIRDMLEADGSFLLDCHTGYDEHVLPMIPPGGTRKDIMTD